MKPCPISQATSRMGAVLLLCMLLMAAFLPISNWIEQNMSYILSTPLIYALRLLAFLLPARLLLGPLPKKPEPVHPSDTPEYWIAWAVLGYGVCLLSTTAVLSVGLGGPTFQTLAQDSPPDLLPNLWRLVFAAFVEELMFRRFYCACLVPYGHTFAILVSAYLFAFFHGNLAQALYALPFGILTGYLYLKTGTIVFPFLVHLLDNVLFQQSLRLHALLLARTGLPYGQGFFLCSLVLVLLSLLYLCLCRRRKGRPSPVFQVRQVLRRMGAQKADYKAAFSSSGMLLVHAWFAVSCLVSLGAMIALTHGW